MSAAPLAARRITWRDTALPFAFLIFANLMWAGNWIVGRAAHDAFPPVALSFYRWLVALLVLLPFAVPRLIGKGHVLRRNWKFLVLLGATGIAVPQCIVYIGLNYTTAVNGSMLNAAIPFMMVLVSWLFDRQMATRRQFLGMALSVAGVLLIVARGDLASLRDFRFNPGDLLVLLSMPIWCVYSVLLRRRPRDIDGLAFLFVLIPIGLMTLLPAYLYETAFVRSPVWNWETLLLVLYAGIAPSAGSYILWNRGVEMIGPNRAAFTNPFQPMFAAILAILILGEPFHPFHAVGFIVIIAGWYLTSGLRLRAGTS